MGKANEPGQTRERLGALRITSRWHLSFIGICVSHISIPQSALAEYETVSHNANSYDGDSPGEGRCCSSCGDLNYTDNDADVFQYAPGSVAAQHERWGGLEVDELDWADGSSGNGDEHDPYGTDWADVAMYCNPSVTDVLTGLWFHATLVGCAAG